MPVRKTTAPEAVRVIEVTGGSSGDKSGKFRVTIPADAKVTFAKVNPQADRGYDQTYAIRIYKTENNQLAVFTGVTGFRDLSLAIEREVISETGSVSWTSSEDGTSRQESTKRTRHMVRE